MSGAVGNAPRNGQGGNTQGGNTQGNVPLLALAAAGAAVVIAMVAAAIGGSPTHMPPSKVQATRLLRFEDEANGAVQITDVETGKLVTILQPGTNGFIRASLRGLAHSGGHEEHAMANHPFRLTARSDGRLVLDDSVAHRSLDLEAFGSLNVAAYAELLTLPERSLP